MSRLKHPTGFEQEEGYFLFLEKRSSSVVHTQFFNVPFMLG